MKEPIVFIAAKRTPFGSFGGSLQNLSATELGVLAAKAALEQGKVPAEKIDHVIFGNVIQTSADAIYLARHIGLKNSIPERVPAVTVNRLCASGFEAIAEGARYIELGLAKTVLVGGTENMSQSPYVIRKARFGLRLGHGELEDSLTAGLFDPVAGLPMALTAELLATEHGISRQDCDSLALESQKRAYSSMQNHLFESEIAPVSLTERGKQRLLSADEHIRPDINMEGLSKLKPVFKKDGVITPGNASGMVDGAVALVLTTKTAADKEGWGILGEYVGSYVCGCDPKRMGIGPVPATQGLLQKFNLSLKEISLIEVNEAFSSQYLTVETLLGLEREKTNIDGGAIAIGHPLGASGARLVAHLLYALKRVQGTFGLASACVGGGQGMSVLVKV